MTAFPQNLPGIPTVISSDLVVPMMVWFWRSTTPFCWGIRASLGAAPCRARRSTYRSLPRWILYLGPCAALASSSRIRPPLPLECASTASLFACSRISHMKWFLSSTNKRKRVLPLGVAGLTDAVGCLRRKGGAPLLADETPIAEPIHAFNWKVLRCRKPSCLNNNWKVLKL